MSRSDPWETLHNFCEIVFNNAITIWQNRTSWDMHHVPETCSWHVQKTSWTCSIDNLKSKKIDKKLNHCTYVATVVHDVKLWQSNYCFALQVHMCKELFNTCTMYVASAWHVQKTWIQKMVVVYVEDSSSECVWTPDRNSTWWDLCLTSRDLILNDIWYLISMFTLLWNSGFLLSRYGRTEHGKTCSSWHYQRTSWACSIDKLKSKKIDKNSIIVRTWLQAYYMYI